MIQTKTIGVRATDDEIKMALERENKINEIRNDIKFTGEELKIIEEKYKSVSLRLIGNAVKDLPHYTLEIEYEPKVLYSFEQAGIFKQINSAYIKIFLETYLKHILHRYITFDMLPSVIPILFCAKWFQTAFYPDDEELSKKTIPVSSSTVMLPENLFTLIRDVIKRYKISVNLLLHKKFFDDYIPNYDCFLRVFVFGDKIFELTSVSCLFPGSYEEPADFTQFLFQSANRKIKVLEEESAGVENIKLIVGYTEGLSDYNADHKNMLNLEYTKMIFDNLNLVLDSINSKTPEEQQDIVKIIIKFLSWLKIIIPKLYFTDFMKHQYKLADLIIFENVNRLQAKTKDDEKLYSDIKMIKNSYYSKYFYSLREEDFENWENRIKDRINRLKEKINSLEGIKSRAYIDYGEPYTKRLEFRENQFNLFFNVTYNKAINIARIKNIDLSNIVHGLFLNRITPLPSEISNKPPVYLPTTAQKLVREFLGKKVQSNLKCYYCDKALN